MFAKIALSAPLDIAPEHRCTNALGQPSHQTQSASSPSDFSNVPLTEFFLNDPGSPNRISLDWIRIIEVLSKTKREKIVALIPGKGITLKDVSRLGHKGQLYHMTSPQNAFSILQSQTPKLTEGSHNLGAFCLGDSNFFMTKLKRGDVSLLGIRFKAGTKYLDLSRNPLGKPSSGSALRQYEWYRNHFLTDLKQGLYSEEFPQLTALIQDPTAPYEYFLGAKEIFGYIVGAPLIETSEKYDWVYLTEYWLIDPRNIIEKIEFVKGAQPAE
jgi:hypothetical protein